MRAFLGIDVGTSAVKVLALSEEGVVIARARRTYPTKTPATNWAEQSPDDWWNAVAGATREIAAAIGAGSIEGVGLSGQLNGFVLLDADDRPLGDAVIWLDLRAQAEAAELAARQGDAIAAVSGNTVSPISILAKLRWMSLHRPESIARTRRLMLVKDYILWRLTGVHAADPSDGSATNLMDLIGQRWSDEMLAFAGVPPAIMPPLRPSAAVAGHVTPEAAAATSLTVGTPVVPGCGDVAALALGCGVIAPGVLGITLGTAGHVVLSGEPREAGTKGFWQIAHAMPERAVWLGLVMSGGLSLAWLHRTFGLGAQPVAFEELVALSDGIPPGARELTFLPFLEGAATPFDRPDMKASFHGLTSSHGAGEMVQAVMEGVAYNIRQCVDLFVSLGGRIEEIRLAEGGARVPRWCQIIADVVARPVSVLAEFDASALGAAMLAVSGVTAEPLEGIAARCVHSGMSFDPERRRIDGYNDGYRRYLTTALREMATDASLGRADPLGV